MCGCVRDDPDQDTNGARSRPARTDGDDAARHPPPVPPAGTGTGAGCAVSVPCRVRGFLARGGHPGGRGRGAATADPPDPARMGNRSAQTLLKILGFVRGQVSQTVAWQATTFALLAALLGVPFGIAGGRWAWRLVADQLGVASGPVVPSAPVLAIAAGALLAANLAAAGPGWAARRVRKRVHAARQYSWTRPPSRSRRCTLPFRPSSTMVSPMAGSGAWSCSARCARCRL
jgi:hypothetical protein